MSQQLGDSFSARAKTNTHTHIYIEANQIATFAFFMPPLLDTRAHSLKSKLTINDW
jgi:hypothetical protein